MRRKPRPKKQKPEKSPGRAGRPPKEVPDSPLIKRIKYEEGSSGGQIAGASGIVVGKDGPIQIMQGEQQPVKTISTVVVDDGLSEGIHMTSAQVSALSNLVACRECGEAVRIGLRPTTKGMISEFTVSCTVCEDHKSTNTPNLIRERKRRREKKDAILQKTENINYAHVAAFLDNGLGYSGLRHYCKYFNSRCLNEATFIVYARQVISDVVQDTDESLHYNASIVREVFKSQLETDNLIDLTVAFTTTYHQWGSDFCLVAGAVIELQTGLVLDYDVANMYCHVCKINAKKIVSMSPSEMTDWFNKHQDTCEIREWCDELDHDAEEGVKEIEPKYLECFVAKKIWSRSIERYGFRYTTLIHESDDKIHEELVKTNVYGDIPILIDSTTSCFSRRKSEHARTSFQTKLKAKCPRERVQTKDRIMYVYAMSIPEYNKFACSSNIKLRQLVREMEEALSGDQVILSNQGIEAVEVLNMSDIKHLTELAQLDAQQSNGTAEPMQVVQEGQEEEETFNLQLEDEDIEVMAQEGEEEVAEEEEEDDPNAVTLEGGEENEGGEMVREEMRQTERGEVEEVVETITGDKVQETITGDKVQETITGDKVQETIAGDTVQETITGDKVQSQGSLRNLRAIENSPEKIMPDDTKEPTQVKSEHESPQKDPLSRSDV